MGLIDLIKGSFGGKMRTSEGEVLQLGLGGLDSLNLGIFKPITFYDVTQFVRKMGKNVPLIVNFMDLKPAEAERSIDFVCGAVCALGGKFERIGEGIYFFAPKNITLDTGKKYKRT